MLYSYTMDINIGSKLKMIPNGFGMMGGLKLRINCTYILVLSYLTKFRVIALGNLIGLCRFVARIDFGYVRLSLNIDW
jgi:hypothetical protein